jgi:hypothetical protein
LERCYFAPPLNDQFFVTLAFLVVSMGTSFGGPTFMIAYQNAIPRRQLGGWYRAALTFQTVWCFDGDRACGINCWRRRGGSRWRSNGAVRPARVHSASVASLVVLLAASLTLNRPLRSAVQDVEEVAVKRQVKVGQPLA